MRSRFLIAALLVAACFCERVVLLQARADTGTSCHCAGMTRTQLQQSRFPWNKVTHAPQLWPVPIGCLKHIRQRTADPAFSPTWG